MMKRNISILLTFLLALGLLAGCGGGDAGTDQNQARTDGQNEGDQAGAGQEERAEPVELSVFAAASMTESMNQIAEMYKEVAPNVTLVYNFDSSGTLKTQIEEGADCDIFISAAQKQMNQLDAAAEEAANPDKLDFVDSASRFDLVSNSVVMIVPEDSDKGISDFADAATDKVGLIALGNSDVPVGQYSEEIYTYMGLWDELNSASKITFGSNVKEVLAQVEAAAVDCGVVYSTDAATATGVKVVATAPQGSHKAITYPAAVMKNAADKEAAQAFIDYLKSDACSAVFEGIGFVIPER